MSSDAVDDAPGNDLSTRGQPFGGAVQNYAKPTGEPTTDPTEIPAHLRMNSRTALFPSNHRTNINRWRHRDSNTSDLEDRCQEAMGGASGRGVAGLNATLGLVIHAMADGVALGASSLSGSGGLGLVVFLAVIVHKGESSAISRSRILTSLQDRPRWASRQHYSPSA